ncbi:class I adenylate-forming enzyme family protein [Pyrolobus fumarii]|nr:class I adenylate-forming enzyme family protein [Pyrolobus fumarii]
MVVDKGPNYRDPGRPMHEIISGHASRNPEKPAVIYEDGTKLTYGELDELSGKLAAALASEANVNKGDVVAIVMFNRPEFVVAYLGALKAGARVVVIDALSMSEDLEYQLNDAKPKATIVDSEVYGREKDREIINKLGGKVYLAEKLREALAGFEAGGIKVEYDADARIFYYAGIVGRTLQVIHTHRSFVGAVAPLAQAEGINEEDVSLVTSPLSHVLGLDAALFTALYAGGTAVMMKRFDEEKAVRLAKEYGVTYMVAAPLVYQRLLEKGVTRDNLPSLKWAMSGGAYLPPEVQKAWIEKVSPLLQVYGMTEAPQCFATTIERNKIGSLGFPLPGVEAKLVDPEDESREVGVGEKGVLLIKGPMVMKGYAEPEETKKAFRGEWLWTGDILERDDEGFYYFRGVKKRMLKYKGYPVFPRDLEILLEKHPAVAKAEVYGEPDPSVGQIPAARVWLKPGYEGSVKPEELMEWVNTRVAPYKKIRKLVIMGTLEK